jgi:uncharacterized protein (TIGR03435 family)
MNTRLSGIVVAFATILAYSAYGQLSGGSKFEAASVRPTIALSEFNRQVSAAMMARQPPPKGGGMNISGLRVDIEGATMKQLIMWANDIDARLIAGPDWVNQGEIRFAIHAVMPAGSTEKQVPSMLESLLEERFHMTAHRALVEQPAYGLVVGKNGPKLKKQSDVDDSVCENWEDALGGYKLCRITRTVGDHNVSIRIMKDSSWGPNFVSMSGPEWHNEYYKITMAKLAEVLAGKISPGGSAGWGGALGPTSPLVQVVDRTGIEGSWDVLLDEDISAPDARFSSISGSLEKQGLRLEKTTAAVEKLIVDKIDAVPTEN